MNSRYHVDCSSRRTLPWLDFTASSQSTSARSFACSQENVKALVVNFGNRAGRLWRNPQESHRLDRSEKSDRTGHKESDSDYSISPRLAPLGFASVTWNQVFFRSCR
jgi:hypothetical protein